MGTLEPQRRKRAGGALLMERAAAGCMAGCLAQSSDILCIVLMAAVQRLKADPVDVSCWRVAGGQCAPLLPQELRCEVWWLTREGLYTMSTLQSGFCFHVRVKGVPDLRLSAAP